MKLTREQQSNLLVVKALQRTEMGDSTHRKSWRCRLGAHLLVVRLISAGTTATETYSYCVREGCDHVGLKIDGSRPAT